VYAFLADHYSNTLAKVLFWAGASLMMLFSGVDGWVYAVVCVGGVCVGGQMVPLPAAAAAAAAAREY
jgi:hypothetical protein